MPSTVTNPSTQSVTLVNQFAAEDIIVTERENGRSTFRRLDQQTIEHWLDEYGMGDLWEKNIVSVQVTGTSYSSNSLLPDTSKVPVTSRG